MATEPNESHGPERLEMPAPTLWPMVLAAAVTLMGAGFVTNWLFTGVGFVIFVVALTSWMMQLMPGQGTTEEELAPPEQRALPVNEAAGEIEHLRPGMAGHRMRVPEKVHPYSAGARGGVIGGIVMTVPAMLYGIFSTHSIWYPINLLAGMVLTVHDPDDFHFGYFVVAIVIHAALSVSLGLMYGVLLPMLPGRPLLWGGLVAPLLWTGASYGFIGVLNPLLADGVNWPSYIAAQFVYGITVGIVVLKSEKIYADEAGVPAIVRRARPTMRMPPDGGRP